MAVSLDPNAPAVYEDGGFVYYRASAVGGCLTSLVAARLEYTAARPPANLQKAYDRGHNVEPVVLDKMVAEGWIVWDRQAKVEIPLTGRIVVVGSIDAKASVKPTMTGTTIDTNESYLAEVKSQGDDEWRAFQNYGWEAGLFPKYKWQISAYMIATGLPLVMFRCHVDKNGEIVEVAVEYIGEPFYSIADIRRRVLTVEMMANKMEMPQCEKPTWGCPYWYLPEHGGESDDREIVDDDSFESVAVSYQTATNLAKINKEKAEALRPVINEYLDEKYGKGKDAKVTTGSKSVKVTRWTQKNPPWLDVPKLVEDGHLTEELVAKYTKQGSGPRLKVTLPKDFQQGLTIVKDEDDNG